LPLDRNGIYIHEVAGPLLPELDGDFLAYEDVCRRRHHLDGHSCIGTVDLNIRQHKGKHLQKGLRRKEHHGKRVHFAS